MQHCRRRPRLRGRRRCSRRRRVIVAVVIFVVFVLGVFAVAVAVAVAIVVAIAAAAATKPLRRRYEKVHWGWIGCGLAERKAFPKGGLGVDWHGLGWIGPCCTSQKVHKTQYFSNRNPHGKARDLGTS